MPEHDHSGDPTSRNDEEHNLRRCDSRETLVASPKLRTGNCERDGFIETCSLGDRDAGAVQAAKILMQGVRAEVQGEGAVLERSSSALSRSDSRGSIVEPPRRTDIPPPTPHLLPTPIKVASTAEEVEANRRQVIRLALDRMVKLNIYDIHKNVSGLSDILHRQMGLGIFHVGVEVYGMEYMFGKTAGNMPRGGDGGVVYHLPRQHDQHHFRECIWMGRTALTTNEVKCLVQNMASDWRYDDYDLASRNCVHFANVLTQILGVGQVPPCFLSSSITLEKFSKVYHRVKNAVDWSHLWKTSSAQQSGDSSSSSEAKSSATYHNNAATAFAASHELSGYLMGNKTSQTPYIRRNLSPLTSSQVQGSCDDVRCEAGWATAQVSWGDLPLEEPPPDVVPTPASSSPEVPFFCEQAPIMRHSPVESVDEVVEAVLTAIEKDANPNSDGATGENSKILQKDTADAECVGWRLDRASTGIGASTMSSLSSKRTSRSCSGLLECSPITPKGPHSEPWEVDHDHLQQAWADVHSFHDVPDEPESPEPPPYVGAECAVRNMSYL